MWWINTIPIHQIYPISKSELLKFIISRLRNDPWVFFLQQALRDIVKMVDPQDWQLVIVTEQPVLSIECLKNWDCAHYDGFLVSITIQTKPAWS